METPVNVKKLNQMSLRELQVELEKCYLSDNPTIGNRITQIVAFMYVLKFETGKL